MVSRPLLCFVGFTSTYARPLSRVPGGTVKEETKFFFLRGLLLLLLYWAFEVEAEVEERKSI